MTHPTAFPGGDPDELGESLLRVARRERAPDAARDRALASVAAVSLSAAVATSGKAALAAPSLTKSGGVLVAKWLVVGLGGALVGLTAAERAQRAFTPAEERPRPTLDVAVRGTPPSAAVPSAAEPSPVASAPSAALPANAGARVPPSGAALPEPMAEPSLAPSAADFAPSATPLAREVTALRRARSALADAKPGQALEILAAHRREYPIGVLAAEEGALRVEIAFALGDARASQLARSFLAEHASSPLAARVRGLLEGKNASRAKP